MSRTLPTIPATELATRLRRHVVDMTHAGRSSHVGSCLGCADIVATLYGEVLSLHSDPDSPERDRFVMSKGHAGAVVYAALAEVGYIPVSELETHCGDGSRLSGHVSHAVPGVELSTGALGHGLSVASGIAQAIRFRDGKQRVYALLSEGDCDEGSTWEAVLFSAHSGLDNLTAIIDFNNLQSLTSVADTVNLEPFADKWRSFGWDVTDLDGHDVTALSDAMLAQSDRPRCIIARTTKGRGVSFMEDSVLWHYRTPQDEEYDAARRELGALT